MGNCDKEVGLYWAVVNISLILTVGLAIYRRKQNRFVNNPEYGKKVYIAVGIIKIIIGSLLLTVLYPADCVNFHSGKGSIFILIGIFWLYIATKLGNRQTGNRNAEMQPMDVEAGTFS